MEVSRLDNLIAPLRGDSARGKSATPGDGSFDDLLSRIGSDASTTDRPPLARPLKSTEPQNVSVESQPSSSTQNEDSHAPVATQDDLPESDSQEPVASDEHVQPADEEVANDKQKDDDSPDAFDLDEETSSSNEPIIVVDVIQPVHHENVEVLVAAETAFVHSDETVPVDSIENEIVAEETTKEGRERPRTESKQGAIEIGTEQSTTEGPDEQPLAALQSDEVKQDPSAIAAKPEHDQTHHVIESSDENSGGKKVVRLESTKEPSSEVNESDGKSSEHKSVLDKKHTSSSVRSAAANVPVSASLNSPTAVQPGSQPVSKSKSDRKTAEAQSKSAIPNKTSLPTNTETKAKPNGPPPRAEKAVEVVATATNVAESVIVSELVTSDIEIDVDVAAARPKEIVSTSPPHDLAQHSIGRSDATNIDASTLESSSPPSTVDHARFVQRIARAMHSRGEGNSEIRLRLSPPELGSLRVEMVFKEGVLTARLEAETPAARNLLLDNMSLLRDRLEQQNVKIARLDVDLMGSGMGDQSSNPSHHDREAWRHSATSSALPRQAASVGQTTGETGQTRAGPTILDGRLNVIV